jgi:hypothetical protein
LWVGVANKPAIARPVTQAPAVSGAWVANAGRRAIRIRTGAVGPTGNSRRGTRCRTRPVVIVILLAGDACGAVTDEIVVAGTGANNDSCGSNAGAVPITRIIRAIGIDNAVAAAAIMVAPRADIAVGAAITHTARTSHDAVCIATGAVPIARISRAMGIDNAAAAVIMVALCADIAAGAAITHITRTSHGTICIATGAVPIARIIR